MRILHFSESGKALTFFGDFSCDELRFDAVRGTLLQTFGVRSLREAGEASL
jgi:1,4-alpha-glucan branching enzyme